MAIVEERWITAADTLWNLDTPALWVGSGEGRVLVTGKDSHDLKVFDGATGVSLPPIGGPGMELGAFQRPNAIVVVGDYGFVVERDNHRVQVLELPSGRAVGALGEEILSLPYGAVASGELPELTLWITDDYEVLDSLAPDYTRRVHRFNVHMRDGAPVLTEHASFGEAGGPGALKVVESIGLDPEGGLLLVADEERRRYAMYGARTGTFEGAFVGDGLIRGDPEGIALVGCPGRAGYWIVTDQRDDVSIFLLFDRLTLEPVGAFRGRITANTDGITFAHGPVPGFPGGVLYAVHDDQALTAFDWNEVSSTLGIPAGCGTR